MLVMRRGSPRTGSSDRALSSLAAGLGGEGGSGELGMWEVWR